ncbi:MAG: hypothetical protein R2771_11325 [Saprospiraceae bacterium]
MFIKPIKADTVSQTTMIGAKYSSSQPKRYNTNSNEKNYFGEVFAYKSYIDKGINYSYGAFAHYGEYNVKQVETFNGPKSYYGGGIAGEVNILHSSMNFEWKIIGYSCSITFENGEYTNFINEAKKLQMISEESFGGSIFESSLFTEIIIHFNKNRISFYNSLGITRSIKTRNIISNYNTFLSFTHDKYSFFINSSSTGDSSYYGVGTNYRIGKR